MSGREKGEELITANLRKIGEKADFLMVLGGTLGREEPRQEERESIARAIREAAAEIMAASNSLLMTRRFLIRKSARV